MKKKAIAIAVAGVMLLSACSSSGGSDAVQVDEANSGLPVVGENITYDPNTLINNGDPISLEWWLWDGDEKFQAFADAYQEIHPNVDIQTVNQPWADYWTKLPLALKGDDGPTLFNVHNSYHENLIPYMEPYDIAVEDLAADYTGVEAHVIDDEVYYIDYGIMSGLIYYNKTLWAEAGLTDADIPETWDEFATVAAALTKHEGDTMTQAGFNYNSLFKEFTLGLAYQQGQNLMESDMVTPDFDNPAMLKSIEMFRDLYKVDQVGSENFGPVAGESFGQGQSAMIYNWGHFYGTLKADYPDLEVGTFRTPVPEAGVEPYAYDRYNGESTLGINASASDAEKAVAQDFLRFYLTDADLMKDLAVNYSLFPAYKVLADDPEIAAHPVMSALGNIDHYIWPGPMPATFESTIDVMWQDILYNGVDAQQALTDARAKISADLETGDFVSTEDQYKYYAPSE